MSALLAGSFTCIDEIRATVPFSRSKTVILLKKYQAAFIPVTSATVLSPGQLLTLANVFGVTGVADT